MIQSAAIALGSNLSSAWGDREANLREAIRRVALLGTVQRVSSFYETEPVGYVDQPPFLNGALLLDTGMQPLDLLRALLTIEREMGRDRSAVVAKGPRIIDLDLLLCGDIVLKTPELTLPHPALSQRRFVLEPLAEIAPELLDPATHRTVAAMLADLA
jgi:2-amino-4-hydroxy-6-hydroxymethyldihydropteridine diphosphokinase